MEDRRTALSLLLVAAGAILLVYGLLSRSSVVSSGEQGQEKVATMSEFAIVREVARGGLKREEPGRIKTTYGEGQRAEDACPT
jgi:hypothetical protein